MHSIAAVLLHYQEYDFLHRDLFHQLTIYGVDINGMDANVLRSLLLFGSHDLKVTQNGIILEMTISFIEATKRLY